MFKILQLDHIVLRVRDVDAMLRFYIDVLGCAMERQQEELGLYQVRAGASLIDLAPYGLRSSAGDANSTSVRGTSAICGMWYARSTGVVTVPVPSTIRCSYSAVPSACATQPSTCPRHCSG